MGRALLRKLNNLRNFVLGREGELAVGEELNQLMLDGCRVFHDIPYRYGNIDHVVVNRSGVYAVNTKMPGKQTASDLGVEVVVDHEKNLVRFPDRDYRIPTEKLETESRWLSNYLGSAVGENIEVESMLALPRWFIKDRIGRGSVYVFNPRSPRQLFLRDRHRLSSQMIKRIAHQIEQLCRNIAPSCQATMGWREKV